MLNRHLPDLWLKPLWQPGLFTLTVVMMVFTLSRLKSSWMLQMSYKLHGIFHRMLRCLRSLRIYLAFRFWGDLLAIKASLSKTCDALSQKMWHWQWKKSFIRNRTMLTFHLHLWEYLIWWSESNSSLQIGTMTLSPRRLYLKGLCKEELYVCRTKTKTDMTFTSLFFSGTMLLYQMWHLEKKNYPRLSSFSKNTSLIYTEWSVTRMKHFLVAFVTETWFLMVSNGFEKVLFGSADVS